MALLWRGRPVGWLRPLAGRSSVGGGGQGGRAEVECGSGGAWSKLHVWGGPRVRGMVAGALAGSERDLTQKLAGLEEEDAREVAAIVNAAEAAADRWETAWTAFHTPPVVHTALSVLAGRADMSAVAWGGYPSAERCCLLLGREEMLPDPVPSVGMAAEVNDSGGRVPEALLEGVEALQVSGNFMFDPANHRDFLGAALGTGIDRKFVGDILVLGERGAQVLVRPSIVQHLQQSLTMVRTVPVETRRIDLQELQVMEPKVDVIKTTEASLRLDAVASSGFRMSRNKMVERVKAGDVRVNWSSKGVKGSMLVQKGDIISCAGKGRIEVTDVGLTKKGRHALVLTRYR